MLLIALSTALAAPIVNGQPEDGFPSVVGLGALLADDAYEACTGNLITPRIVLTAAHCGEDLPPELIVVAGRAFFGADMNAADAVLGIESYAGHPDYVPLENGLGGTLGEFDAGVIVLAEDAPVEPAWLRRDPIPEEEEGRELLSVGFGVTSAAGEGSGLKRSAELTLSSVEEMFLIAESDDNEASANICSGDSGGPQFAEEDGRFVQWAIHSWGDTNCTFNSGSTRVDVVYGWVMEQVEAVHGTDDLCEINGWYGDGACDAACDAVDPDCEPASEDGESRKGCSAVPFAASGLLPLLAALAGLAARRRA